MHYIYEENLHNQDEQCCFEKYFKVFIIHDYSTVYNHT